MDKVTRRSFVTTVGAATVVPATALLPLTAHAAAAATPAKTANVAEPPKTTYLFFNTAEVLYAPGSQPPPSPVDGVDA